MVRRTPAEVDAYLRSFTLGEEFSGQRTLDTQEVTRIETGEVGKSQVIRYINEFWTARQRQAARIHEISYRACFKPQLPRFFISLLTSPDDIIYDPFAGRGTTPLEAGLLGRRVIANDINPLSAMLSYPRFFIPMVDEVRARLLSIPYQTGLKADRDLSMFYHPDTEAEIVSLRQYLLEREENGEMDHLDRWIRMVATNRLTGHSPGFFSVYTLPPNQAVSPERQVMINEKREQQPPYRSTRDIILKKTKGLIKDLTARDREHLRSAGERALMLTGDARKTREIPDGTVSLTVTSPPFLDIVQYSADNWLRCWFTGVHEEEIAARITSLRRVSDWRAVMNDVFSELFRITRPGGWVAFEVGEVRNKSVLLDEVMVPVGEDAGFICTGIVINSQEFTKTANIWGVSNMVGGTNTNRIVLFYKEEKQPA